MATNLAIDDKLINDAVKLGHHSTKKEAVTAALEEYIQHHKQQQIIEVFGTFEFSKNYNYKKLRQRKI